MRTWLKLVFCFGIVCGLAFIIYFYRIETSKQETDMNTNEPSPKITNDNPSQTDERMRNKTIVIDAGHGGTDTGAISTSGVFEKDLTYETASLLKKILTTIGADVIMTREHDDYITLATRANLANMNETDAFISIHYNSVQELPEVTGISTFYYDKANKQLAEVVQTNIIGETKANDRGISFADFQVLRDNIKPAILLELGFLSNQETEQKLLDKNYQQLMVDGITKGLLTFFSKEHATD
ncbi:N-acetylmuramoyl-L-alanine amidase family protein [Lentibacillus daqui]|uniref:N-acetylmuramoyl-L-alanine amidase family protein n=1 Tax=Lentibacillus daqui TaxID=2911514 RepID=UPI0022B17A53|nr:N-acetylmuramoyl-L-alanine amidase [Lentibacillus daqui]